MEPPQDLRDYPYGVAVFNILVQSWPSLDHNAVENAAMKLQQVIVDSDDAEEASQMLYMLCTNLPVKCLRR